MTITRQSVVEAARSYLGVRYHHQGRTRAGLDCAGLIVCVAQDLGIPTTADISGYARTPDGVMLKALLDTAAVPVTAWQEGDILLLRFDAAPQHLAIVTEAGMIHSYLAARRVVEHRLDEQWRARIVAAYAYPGVSEESVRTA